VWGAVLGMNPSAARKLLFSMLSDDQLASPTRCWYTLSDEQTLPDQDDVSGESVDVTPDVSETAEPRVGMPILEHSPSGVYVYSERDGGMIPHEWSRERKGYR
jgi:hypothetical protein